jgi:hypothetical protein
MKKTLLFLLATAGLTLQTFGQGQLVFANTATASTHIWTNSTASTGTGTGAQIAGAGSYVFALFYNSTTNSGTTAGVSASATPWNTAGWTLVDGSGYATNTASTGRITGLVSPLFTSISALASGTYANLEVIGWNTEGGTVNTLSDFETAYAHALALTQGTISGLMYGNSSVASILLGNNVLPLNSNVFGTNPGQITGFTLGQVLGTAPVPEPGTMALAVLGGASLFLFRRRKA